MTSSTTTGELQRRLGHNLRAKRKAWGLSQDSFAEHLGVSRSYLSGVERGKWSVANDYRLEEAGAELVSCSEHIDRSPAGRLNHTVLSGVNTYQSDNMSDEIKRKTLIKIREGGTHGVAPLGYKNVGEGSKRYVIVDPEPARLITWAFEAYATGEWNVKDLLAEATDRGLRSRGGPTYVSKPLSLSQMHRILRNPYYKGIVRFNGVEYQGKHDKLVDEDTWQKVQDVLASKANGEKQRDHHHYLKGTILCGHCGSRLCVSYSRGKTGAVYPYYFCVGRQQKRTTCMLKYRPIALVEEQIEEHYRFVQLTARGLLRTAEAITDELAAQAEAKTAERQHQATRLKQLEAERTKLMQAHYAGAVPLDLLKSEQQRITDEMATVKGLLAAAEASVERVHEVAVTAAKEAENCHQAYLKAGDHERRLMNQAFFQRVLVTEDGVVKWEYQEPFATLMELHGAPTVSSPELTTEANTDPGETTEGSAHAHRRTRGYERKRPDRGAGALATAFLGVSSKETHLAEGVGFEPTGLAPARFQGEFLMAARTPLPACRRDRGYRRSVRTEAVWLVSSGRGQIDDGCRFSCGPPWRRCAPSETTPGQGWMWRRSSAIHASASCQRCSTSCRIAPAVGPAAGYDPRNFTRPTSARKLRKQSATISSAKWPSKSMMKQ